MPSRFGKTTRSVRFPFGERTVVEWGGTEPLTVPRHTHVRRVRSYFRAPRLFAYAGLIGPLAAPFVRLGGRVGGSPSASKRERNRFDGRRRGARGRHGVRRATLTGYDTLRHRRTPGRARRRRRLRAGEARGAGALAPAEAFDVREVRRRGSAPLLEVGRRRVVLMSDRRSSLRPCDASGR